MSTKRGNGKASGKWFTQRKPPKAKGDETVIIALSRNQWDTTIAALSHFLQTVKTDYADEPQRRDRMVMEIKIIMGAIGSEQERD